MDGAAAGLAREVGDHIAALHLAVDEDVDAHILLEAYDLLGSLKGELFQFPSVDLAGDEGGPGFRQVGWLGETADCGG